MAGILLGANPFLSKAFESYIYYLGPTPKIIFFPVMIMWFGVGPESKVALGTLSCFFPVALSVAAGMRGIDKVLIRVGNSFRANAWQMVVKIYLPAMRHPIINGIRLGLGVALIGTLLAETKLSNKGIGFLIINAYQHLRHAAHVRHADRAVRAGDRRQCAGRPARRPRQHQARLMAGQRPPADRSRNRPTLCGSPTRPETGRTPPPEQRPCSTR